MGSPIDEAGALPHRSLLALIWTCYGIAFLFVLARTTIRVRIGTRFNGEDFWMFLALVMLLALCILETIQLDSLYYMTAVIQGVIPPSVALVPKTEEYLRYEFPIVILFFGVLWCVKAAFLALYYKLFREIAVYRRVWYVLATFTLLAYGGCVLSLSLSCSGKIANFFKFNMCGSASDIWSSNFNVWFSTIIDVFTDLCSKSQSATCRVS